MSYRDPLYLARKQEAAGVAAHYHWLDNGGREKLAEFRKLFTELGRKCQKPIPVKRGNAVILTFLENRTPHTEVTTRICEERLWEETEYGGFTSRPLPDYDDAPVYNIEDTESYQWAESARNSLLEISKRETGNYGDPQRLEADRNERQDLKDQSHRIAAILESFGISAYRNDGYGIYVYHVHTGTVEQLPKFRRISFLPYVAAQLRAPMVTALESYLEEHPFCRMWTFTSGKRVKVSELRQAIKNFHRRLSRFASWLRTKGVEMVFRSTELGTPENAVTPNLGVSGEIERDSYGEALFHVHAHCLVRIVDGPMSKDAWEDLLRAVWAKWGNHWDDGKSVQDARELCKYVFKPGELLSLKDSEIVELYHQLRRLKIVAPLGDLKERIKARNESKKRLVREPTPDGKVYREVNDWNRQLGKKSKIEEAIENAVEEGLADKIESDRPKVLAQCIPGFAPGSCLKEPRVVVMSKHWQQNAVEAHPLVSKLKAYTRAEWNAGVRAAELIRVHTGTSTVQGAQQVMPWMIDVEERLNPPGPPIFEEMEVFG